MYKKSLLPLIIFFSIAVGFIIGKFTYQSNNLFYSQNKDFLKLKSVIDLIENNYKGKINVFDFLHKSLLKKLTEIDPYSYYLENEYIDDYEMDNSGIFNGLGISYFSYNDTIRILGVYENSPAEEAGLKVFDQILSVNGISVVGVMQDSVAKIFKNKKKFDLEVKNFFTGQISKYRVKKKDISLSSVEFSKIDDKTGYIKIDRFSQNTYDFFVDAANYLLIGGLDYLILDLRDNPGGILGTSVDILDEFFSSNDTLIITNTNENKETTYLASPGGLLADVQVIVLINDGSASASELLSVSLQDLDRALFIGTNTYGKGVFQQNIKTVQNDFLHITTGKYYGPSGRWIDHTDALAEYDFEYFKTKHGRVVTSRNGIVPDIYYDYYGLEKIVDILDNYAYEFVLEHKKMFIDIDADKIDEISKSIVDTTDIFMGYIETAEPLAISFSKYFLDKSYYQKQIIKSDSVVIKALEIIDGDLIQEKIYEKDTIRLELLDYM
ncbi:MAG: PDZ domain-containing protein [Bacteroidales bacterium]|nr:PDZ domain-containing protein [Bacteroidales bacterium]